MKNFFLGIGAQKAGTTWLSDYLSKHPSVFISPLKEMHFFNSIYATEYCKNYDNRFSEKLGAGFKKKINTLELHLAHRIHIGRNLGKYKKYFDAYSPKHKMRGEITPAYSLLSESGFKVIRKHFPEIKIIFIIRNPIDRFWSSLRFTGKTIKGFDPISNFDSYLNNPIFTERGNYENTILKLGSVFKKKEFKIIFFEKLFNENHHESCLKEITKFLKIKYLKADINLVSNQSTKSTLPIELYHQGLVKFNNTYKFCEKYFGGVENLPLIWKESMELLNQDI